MKHQLRRMNKDFYFSVPDTFQALRKAPEAFVMLLYVQIGRTWGQNRSVNGRHVFLFSLWRVSILLRHPEDKSEGGSDVIPILFPSTGIGGVVPAPPPFPPPPPPSICFCFSRLPSRAFKEPRNFLHGERGGKATAPTLSPLSFFAGLVRYPTSE